MIILARLSFSQTTWQRSSGNLVMIKTTNSYEGTYIGSPSVIEDNDTLKMLYAGNASAEGRILYAYSLDGITWTKQLVPALDVAAMGSWDSYFLDTPDWLKDNTGYKMYYFGDTDNLSNDASIGLATSPDGRHWSRMGNTPVLSPGNPGDWDGLFVGDPTVVYDGTTYYMWYSGVDTTWKVRIGLATSPNGLVWTKYSGNPVLDGGSVYSWEGYNVGVPSVMKRNGTFEMWYNGVSYFDLLDGNIDTIKIGYATSPDGMNWTKYHANPVLGTYSAGYTTNETRGPWAPDVVFRSSDLTYYMWYETSYGFGLAKSAADIQSVTEDQTEDDVSVYPNPVKQVLNIKCPQHVMDSQVEIYNSVGERMQHGLMNSSGELDVSNLPSGLYFLKLKGDPRTIKKFMKP
jgi:predicted GH43/DUF377 family glycosyl hydrolase